MKRKMCFECVFVLIFVFLIVSIGAVTVVKEKDTFSDYENRTLAVPPVASFASVSEGTYFSLWESYFSDHALGRKTLLKTSVLLDRDVFHRPVINDVVVLEDQLLPYLSFQDPKVEKLQEESEQVADALAEVAELTRSYGGTFLLVTIPTTYDYFADQYPNYLNNRATYTDTECEIFFSDLKERNVSYLDIGTLWEQKGCPEGYMSTVDHHFTWEGAYSVYEETMMELNRISDLDLRRYDKSEFHVTELPNPYMGSYLRKIWALWDGTEHLSYGELKTPVPFVRSDLDETNVTGLFIPVANAEGNVDYNLYMGGDMSKTVIDTDRSNLPDLLVFGDSFTNAEETLLYASFDTMTSLDFRYYDEMTLAEYVKKYQPDIVLGFRDYESMTNPLYNGLCGNE